MQSAALICISSIMEHYDCHFPCKVQLSESLCQKLLILGQLLYGLFENIPWIHSFLAHFMNELMQSRGVRRPSVRLSATSTTNMTRSPPNLNTMFPTWACIQGVHKVKVKIEGHVIRTLLWFHENRLLSQTNDWIATKLAHDGPH